MKKYIWRFLEIIWGEKSGMRNAIWTHESVCLKGWKMNDLSLPIDHIIDNIIIFIPSLVLVHHLFFPQPSLVHCRTILSLISRRSSVFFFFLFCFVFFPYSSLDTRKSCARLIWAPRRCNNIFLQCVMIATYANRQRWHRKWTVPRANGGAGGTPPVIVPRGTHFPDWKMPYRH